MSGKQDQNSTRWDIIELFLTWPYSRWVAQIQSKNHASNKGETAGGCQNDIHLTGIGLRHTPKGENRWAVAPILLCLLSYADN